jgi:hypothetical protein
LNSSPTKNKERRKRERKGKEGMEAAREGGRKEGSPTKTNIACFLSFVEARGKNKNKVTE